MAEKMVREGADSRPPWEEKKQRVSALKGGAKNGKPGKKERWEKRGGAKPAMEDKGNYGILP